MHSTSLVKVGLLTGLTSVDLSVLVKLIQERPGKGRMVFYPFFRDENIRIVLIRDIIILIGGG